MTALSCSRAEKQFHQRYGIGVRVFNLSDMDLLKIDKVFNLPVCRREIDYSNEIKDSI